MLASKPARRGTLPVHLLGSIRTNPKPPPAISRRGIHRKTPVLAAGKIVFAGVVTMKREGVCKLPNAVLSALSFGASREPAA